MYQAHNNLPFLITKHKKNYKLALDHINFAISLHSDAEYLSNKASLLEEMGDIDLALKPHRNQLIKIQNSKAYYNQGRILQELVTFKKH